MCDVAVDVNATTRNIDDVKCGCDIVYAMTQTDGSWHVMCTRRAASYLETWLCTRGMAGAESEKDRGMYSTSPAGNAGDASLRVAVANITKLGGDLCTDRLLCSDCCSGCRNRDEDVMATDRCKRQQIMYSM